MSHSARPYSSTGLDQAMSDQRVQRLSLHVNRENRAHHRADWLHVTVWDRALPEAPAPDWYRLGLCGVGYELTVHLADGRSMGMTEYLRVEAGNAVRMTKAERRAARAERRVARAAEANAVRFAAALSAAA